MTEQRKQLITETIKNNPGCSASQGGGLVMWDKQQHLHFFVLPPEWGDYKVGDVMPYEWSTGPLCMAT